MKSGRLPINQIFFALVIVSFLFVITSCSKTDKTNNTTETTTTTPTTSTTPTNPAIATTGDYVQYTVTQTEFDQWRTLEMTGNTVMPLIKQAAKDVYKIFNDKFDFLFFVINSYELATGRPYGQSYQTKNNITGLGSQMGIFDEDSDYGSAGQLQHITMLYKLKNSSSVTYSYVESGPLVHEICHRWIQFSSSVGNVPHWPDYTVTGAYDANAGIFASPTNKLAQVELYLAGMIPSSSVTDATNKTLMDKIITESGERNPSSASSPKSFRGLVVVVTPSPLSDSEADILHTGITNFCKTNSTSTLCNFYRQMDGKATMKLDGLNDSDTKK